MTLIEQALEALDRLEKALSENNHRKVGAALAELRWILKQIRNQT